MKAPRRSCVECGRVIKDGSHCELHDYRALYTEAEYHRNRTLALIRADSRCEACGSRANLEVDHIQPLIDGGDNSLDNLQVLCRGCHRAKTESDQGRRAL